MSLHYRPLIAFILLLSLVFSCSSFKCLSIPRQVSKCDKMINFDCKKSPDAELDRAMYGTYEMIATEVMELQRQCSKRENEFLLVGIAGPPGSGKSTLSKQVKTRLEILLREENNFDGRGVQILPMDGYHYSKAALRALHPQPLEQNEAMERRGAYWTFDGSSFIAALRELRLHHSGFFPSFEHVIGDPVPDAIHIDSRKHSIVLVEGNYLLLGIAPWDSVKEELDFCFFIECDVATLKERVFLRHMSTGDSAERARYRVENNDGPNAELVLQYKQRADRLIKSV